jgi:pyruvate dehydrogenase E2 component (dihydrolipoamide acetyltransferase)
MTESVSTKPSVALTLHADASGLMALREQTKKTQNPLKYDEMLVAIIAKALREFPILNSKIVDDEIHLLDEINVGVAVDTENGLIVPVIHNADKKGLVEIRDELGSKVQAVKTGKTNLEDITGGTFTVTNLGMFGIEQFDAIINPPEAGILAIGTSEEKLVVIDGEPVVRSRVRVTMSCDHRVIDGAVGAKFLQTLRRLIENPLMLVY